MKYLRILSAVAATPWAIDEVKGHAMLSFLEFAASGGKRTQDELASILARDDAPKAAEGSGSSGRGGAVAVLALRGVILPRLHDFADISSGGGTSAEGFGHSFKAAVRDPNVGAIVIDVDSPGGSSGGVMEVAAEMRAARGSKPIVAVAAPFAASAAYWIASAADELVVAPSGMVGSVGVYIYHESIAKMLEMKGIEPTLIKAGENKGGTLPSFPLSDDTKAFLKQQADVVKRQFVNEVAANRRVSAEVVEASFGDGRSFTAEEAVRRGMADRIGTLDDEISRLAAELATANARSRSHALALA